MLNLNNSKNQSNSLVFKPAYKSAKMASLEIQFVNALIAYSKVNGTSVKVGK